MAQDRTGPGKAGVVLDKKADGRRLVSWTAAGVIAVLVVGAGGWWLNSAVNPTPTVHATTTSSFTGRIVDVDQAGHGGCVVAQGTTRRVCSVLLPLDDSVQVRVGERVKVAHTRLYTGGGNGYDALLLYPAS